MGYIARAQLASAVSNAGGMGIIETSSGRLDEVREEIVKMHDLTDKPWGVNVAHLFVRGVEELVQFVVDNGVDFVTTSAGDPAKLVPMFKAEGITTYHVVPTLRGALKSIAAGVDGIVVEGIEGGGFKNPDGASTMVLVPLIASKVDVPIIAAGGIVDGPSMAAAFALGADAVQMGTRMISAAESPVHENWKQAIIDAAESDGRGTSSSAAATNEVTPCFGDEGAETFLGCRAQAFPYPLALLARSSGVAGVSRLKVALHANQRAHLALVHDPHLVQTASCEPQRATWLENEPPGERTAVASAPDSPTESTTTPHNSSTGKGRTLSAFVRAQIVYFEPSQEVTNPNPRDPRVCSPSSSSPATKRRIQAKEPRA